MQIAKEAHGAAVGPQRHQNVDSRGFGKLFRFDQIAVFVEGLKMAAIEMDIKRIFAGEHRVRLRAGGHQNASRRERHCFTVLCLDL